MNTRLRNSCIAILSLVGFSSMYRTLLRRRGPVVRVVVFHDVEDLDWFRETITFMRKKYHLMSPDDVQEKIFIPEKINVLITFDDGYASWLKTLPILDAFGIKALFFINSGLLDAYDNKSLQHAYVREGLRLTRERSTLSWDGLATIIKKGHTIGGHTTTHRSLSELSEKEEERTICADRERIKEKTGLEPVFFAFPFGNKSDFTASSIQIANAAGYRYLFSTVASFWVPTEGGVIPRLCLEDGMSMRMLRYWIEGGYDLYYLMKQLCVR